MNVTPMNIYKQIETFNIINNFYVTGNTSTHFFLVYATA